MERCPNCHARGDETATCRRCGMDLAALMEVEAAAERLTALGIAHLAVGDPVAARGELTRALRLQRVPFAEIVLGFAEHLEKAAVQGSEPFANDLMPRRPMSGNRPAGI